MKAFRIIRTQALTHVLPYAVEERRRVWYLPWPVWRSLKERSLDYGGHRLVVRRFQTAAEARLCIEHMQAQRARQKARQQCQQQSLPRLGEPLRVPLPG